MPVYRGEVLAEAASAGTQCDDARDPGARRSNAPKLGPGIRYDANRDELRPRQPDVAPHRADGLPKAEAHDHLLVGKAQLRHDISVPTLAQPCGSGTDVGAGPRGRPPYTTCPSALW